MVLPGTDKNSCGLLSTKRKSSSYIISISPLKVPAVSIGLWIGGRFDKKELLPYIAAQVFGGIAGATVLFFIASGKAGFEIGGFASIENQEVPPHWLAYVHVKDVDKLAAKTEELGGKVTFSPTDIPKVGRFTVIQDPQGAIVAGFTSFSESLSADEAPKIGEFCWSELMTIDPDGAKDFYTRIFKWEYSEMTMGDTGKYYIAKINDSDAAGLMKRPDNVSAPPHWMNYINVENLDATTDKAKSLGAKILVPPTAIPDMGRFSTIQDPQGAVVSFFSQ